MHFQHTNTIFLLVGAFAYVSQTYILPAEACLARKRSEPIVNSLLTYIQSSVEPKDLNSLNEPLAATHDIYSVFLGYTRHCLSDNNAKLSPRNTLFGSGMLLYPDPMSIETNADAPLERPCIRADSNEKPDQFCQVWTNENTWSRLAKVQLDITEDDALSPELIDGWEVADRYGYDAPPLITWQNTRFIPKHLIRPDPDVTGAIESVRVSSTTRQWIADDGGIRLDPDRNAPPLLHLVCPYQRQKTGLGQISNVIEWDDASHLSFRPASELAKRRVVAVGDLHGDFANSLNVFKMANIIDEEGHWAGGNYTVFVQTGDIVDRGHDTIALYTFMRRLKTEASNAGGRVVQLLGNHELMNVANDLRYVTTEDYASFGGPYERQKAFSQYGSIGSRLFKLHLVHRVGDTVFTHGGINEEWAQHGVRKTNRDTTKGLPPYIAETDMYQRYYGWPIFGDEGPAWYRGYALHAEDYICRSLYRALKKLNVKRMVVGHTWQQSGRVLSRCNNRFFVIDIGISAVYGRFQGALEIDPSGQVTALYPKGPETLVQPPTKTL